MDSLAIEKATIVDMSFGGQTGQVFALENPDRVARLVQLAAAVRLPAIFYNEPTDARLALQAAFADPSIQTLRTMMNRFLYRGEQYSDEELMLEHRLEAWLSRPDQREALASSQNVQRNVNEELHRITAPVLMIFGRDDRIIGSPEGTLALLNYLKDARLIILKNCGHWIPFERPQEFSRYVIDFVKNTPAA
jgi:2-hydroxy-6-oxonona-2,4-dienedioate hydrolase